MRKWDSGNPKAGLMERKRNAIIGAALTDFLQDGYAGSSVNKIAAEAGVSIKTLYRHFESKDDLFVAVIQTACTTTAESEDPQWFTLPPPEGLTQAGAEHLSFILEPDQLALYRVVTRDAQRFPQLGQRYQEKVVGERLNQVVRYIDLWPGTLRTKISDTRRAACTFSALLHGDLLETALHTGCVPNPADLREHAGFAATSLLTLLDAHLI
ncbi:TetR/AcrR family transcriptional regulator [Streptomyces sp. DSM 41524]|uniref:TetR/AcrR family transcriptional regulator n=1 Tax=Streptomyces asiaticus subsp. ignotus TaxID=3098222 RepID=A0ABU7QD58_9ACTN|nr:TetR/AcrR family transcriptional regulator [Streptomyces sp. DSM 41524]